MAVLAGLGALVAYVLTVDRSLPTGDSGDLISAAYVLGIPHPPGYPLYTMLAHLAMLVPVGSPALAANLLSAVLDAAAVSIVVVAIYQLVAGRSPEGGRTLDRPAAAAAIIGALLLAFSTTFWAYSLVAEVFALNNLFAALLLLIGLRWARQPRPPLLGLLGLLFGLALTNQQTIIVLAPALALLVVVGLRRQWRSSDAGASSLGRVVAIEIAAALLLVVVGLLPYLYLPFAAAANPPVDWGDPRTLSRFLDVVTRSSYGSLSLGPGLAGGSVIEQLVLLGQNLASGFVVIGMLVAVIGCWWLAKHDRAAGAAIGLAFLVSGPLFVAYANPNYLDPVTKAVVERFYILPAIPIGLAIGAGSYQLLSWGERLRIPAIRSVPAAGLVGVVLGLLVAVSAIGHAGAVDQSGNELAAHYGEDLLSDLGPNAVLLMRGDEDYTSVAYAQLVEDYRRDVSALDVELLKLPTYVETVRRLHPGLVIPWTAYDEGVTASLADIVRANRDDRPIYYVGVMKETSWTSGYDEIRAGLVRQLVPKGQGSDPYQLLRQEVPTFAQLRYPTRAYPDTTWEHVLAEHYGLAAFDLAYAIQSGSSSSDLPAAEQMYRTAIRLLPDSEIPAAYKNLGLLLQQQGGDPKEIVALWEHYLRLQPDDPAAGAIRQQIQALGGSPP